MTRDKINSIIFEHDTKASKLFDIILLWVILFSVVVVVLESVPAINAEYFIAFSYVEWIIAIIFTIEYLLRIWSSKIPFKYIFCFIIISYFGAL